jgi:hypothetical protein
MANPNDNQLFTCKEKEIECEVENDGVLDVVVVGGGGGGVGEKEKKLIRYQRIIFGMFLFVIGRVSVGTSTIPLLTDGNNSVLHDTFKSDKDTFVQERDRNSPMQHMLHSHTYSNCPFAMLKFNQFELSNEGPYTSDMDRLINSVDRGKIAKDFSNNNRAYERVVKALKFGAFRGRKVVLDGDSLTRQLFISLGCLAWSAGYVDEYEFKQDSMFEGGENTILNNARIEASSKFINEATLHLKGGGKIYYVGNPIKEKIKAMTDTMMNNACNVTASVDSLKKRMTPYRVRYNFKKEESLHLRKRDVHILAAGHHEERDLYISAYKRMFECMKNGTKDFDNWPHIMYQLSSVESFWTETGMHGNEFIKGANEMSCQSNPKTAPHRDEERDVLGGLVDFIGDSIDLEHLGQLHVWHGDCLHWLQPGIPDLYAAEVADYLLSSRE